MTYFPSTLAVCVILASATTLGAAKQNSSHNLKRSERSSDLMAIPAPTLSSEYSYDEPSGYINPQSKRFNEFIGKRSMGITDPGLQSNADNAAPLWTMTKVVAVERAPAKRQYDFVGKRTTLPSRLCPHALGKRYDFVGKRSPNSLLEIVTEPDLVTLGCVGFSKRYDFVGKRDSVQDIESKRYDFVGKRGLPYEDDSLAAKRYDFVGKRTRALASGKRNYEFVGKRAYDFVGKRDYDFVGKRDYDFVGKRGYEFVGKRGYEFVGKRNNIVPRLSPIFINPLKHLKPGSLNNRTSKRADEISQESFSDRKLAALLKNRGLRKRLSKYLFNSKLSHQIPQFIGK